MIAKIILSVWALVCIWLVADGQLYVYFLVPLRDTDPLLYVLSFLLWWLIVAIPTLLIAAMFKKEDA